MNFIRLLLGVILCFGVPSCDLLGLPNEATIIYDVELPPNPTPSFTLSSTVFSINETGGTATISVSLGARPMTDRTVVIVFTNPNTSRLSVSPRSVSFNNSSWGSRSVTFTGIGNNLQDGNVAVNIPVTVTGTDWRFNKDVGPQSVQVTVVDDDMADIVLTESSGSTSVTEAGSTDTIDVVLSAQPSSNVGLTVTSSDTTEATVSVGSLTFTTGNWNTAQTVTITGQNDLVQDGDVTSSITFAINSGSTADSNYLAVANKTVTMSTIDNDVAGFTIAQSGGSTGVTEMGGTDTVTVVLDTEPTATVLIDLVSTDSTEVSVSPTQLTFTASNWTTAQTVTFTGLDDLIDDGNVNTTINAEPNSSTSDTVYRALGRQTFAVSNTDNDSSGITTTQTGGSTIVGEDGAMDKVGVKLDTEPTGNVVLNLSISDTTEAIFVTAVDNDTGYPTSTSTTTSLSYTTSNWMDSQIITLQGVDDNVADDNVSINAVLAIDVAATADTNYDALGSVTVPVIVTDNDSAGFTLSDTDGNTRVYETGATDRINIVLTSEPTNTVQFNVVSATTSEVTIDTATITFNAGNWNTPQTISVRGVDDASADGNTTNTVTVSINTANTLDSVYDLVPSQNHSVINNDNDVAGITVDPMYGTIVEETGTTATYTVVLNSQPSGNVLIDTASSDTGELTVSPPQLTFTTSNWNTPQTATVTGIDDNIDDGTVNANVTNTPNAGSADVTYRSVGAATVVASTRDNDTAGITIALTGGSNSVTEPNTTDTFTMVLDSEPTGNVVINVTSSDTSEATVSPSSATFTAGNWNTPQTVTMTAANDFIVDGTLTSIITLEVNDGSTADSVYDAVDNTTTPVTTTDDDSLGINASPSSASINEGATSTIGVTLNAQPSANVVLDLTLSNSNEASIDVATMTFTTSNYATAQNVVVTSIDDDVDDGNISSTLDIVIDEASTSDAVWYATADRNVALTTVDNDTAAIVVAHTGGSTATSEDGAQDTIVVTLASEPTNTVVIGIALATSDSTEMTLSHSSFTFLPSNWNTPQNLILTGLDDNIDDGNISNTVNFTINTGSTLDSTYDTVSQQTVSVSNTDDDAVALNVVCCGVGGPGTTDGDAGPMNEVGGSNTLVVSLGSEPTGNVVLSIADVYTARASSSPSSLTFTTSNWATPQTVTTSAVNNNQYNPDQIATTRLSINTGSTADSNYDALSSVSRKFQIINEDDNRTITIDVGDGLSTNELLQQDTFTVVLDSQPVVGQTVVLDVASADTSEVVITTGASLTFTNGNWNTPQTVTITGVDDVSSDGDQNVNITINSNASGTHDAWDSSVSRTIVATNQDNEIMDLEITESGGSTILSENGTTDTIGIELTALPLFGNVIVDVTISDSSEISGASPAQLTFTSMDWNTPQTVTLTPVNDGTTDGRQSVTITATVSGSSTDFVWAGSGAAETVTAYVDDDDIGVTLTRSAASIAESGGTSTLTATLSRTATIDAIVSIDAAGSSNATLTQDYTIPATITVSAGATTGTGTLTGVDDDYAEGSERVTVEITSVSGGDGAAELSPQSVTVDITDDDEAALTFRHAGVEDDNSTVTETGTSGSIANTDTLTYKLKSKPTGDVVVDLASEDTGEFVVSPAQMTFTTTNWNVDQTVTVTGVIDGIIDGNITTNLRSSINTGLTYDATYDTLSNVSKPVIIYDMDSTPLVSLASNVGGMAENGGSITVQANQNITAGTNTTVSLGVTGGTASAGEYSLASSSVTITAGSLQGTTTLTAVNDFVDEGTETVILEITGVSGGDSASENGTQIITLSINDDDTTGFTYAHSGGATTVAESSSSPTSDTFTVVLDTLPTGNVKIDIASQDSTEISVSPVGLLFKTSDWNTPQTITVTAVDDSVEDGTVAAEVLVSIDPSATADSNYDAAGSQRVTVSVTDDDTTGIADFAMTTLERDYNKVEINWNAPASGMDITGSDPGDSDDSFRVFMTTVAPLSRTPANRLIDETDTVASSMVYAWKTQFIQGILSTGTTYYFRVAAVDENGKLKFSTNELSGSPLPAECTSTSATSDTDSDLLVYIDFEGDLNDSSPQGSRTGAEGWPYNLTQSANGSAIEYVQGCGFGLSAYLDGNDGGDSTADTGTYAQNMNFTELDLTPGWTLSMWISPDGDMEKYAAAFSSGNDRLSPQFQIDISETDDGVANTIGRLRWFNRRMTTQIAYGPWVRKGSWYHVTGVHNASNDELTMYVNGIRTDVWNSWANPGTNYLWTCNQMSSPNCGFPTTQVKYQWGGLRLGMNRQGKVHWKGFVDEIKLFNREFTQAEVTALYNKSLPGLPPNVAVTSVGGGSADITITWTAVPAATSYTLFRVERSQPNLVKQIIFENPNLDVTGTDITKITNVAAGCVSGTCSYTDSDSGLVFNRYYYYRVSAVNSIGTGNPGSINSDGAQAL
jgi:large repetitive protein